MSHRKLKLFKTHRMVVLIWPVDLMLSKFHILDSKRFALLFFFRILIYPVERYVLEGLIFFCRAVLIQRDLNREDLLDFKDEK